MSFRNKTLTCAMFSQADVPAERCICVCVDNKPANRARKEVKLTTQLVAAAARVLLIAARASIQG